MFCFATPKLSFSSDKKINKVTQHNDEQYLHDHFHDIILGGILPEYSEDVANRATWDLIQALQERSIQLRQGKNVL